MTHRTEWPDYEEKNRTLESLMMQMAVAARANGWHVIVCDYNGLGVPVLKVIADVLGYGR